MPLVNGVEKIVLFYPPTDAWYKNGFLREHPRVVELDSHIAIGFIQIGNELLGKHIF
jgi:hypothetical protein